MNISLNGDKREVPESLTITGLLDFLNIQHRRVAVELNLEIVKKDKYAATVIKEGDSLEVVSFMGGGSASAECGVWNENEKSGVSAYERR